MNFFVERCDINFQSGDNSLQYPTYTTLMQIFSNYQKNGMSTLYNSNAISVYATLNMTSNIICHLMSLRQFFV
jgi:hypothetical protein